MRPDGLMAKATSFFTNNPAVQDFQAWMMSQPALAQLMEWLSLLNQNRWGFIIVIMALGLLLRFISPFVLIFRLLWTTIIRLFIAILVQTVIIPVNRFSAWLSRPRPQGSVHQTPPPPGPDDQRR